MVYYDIIDISERTDVSNTSESNECDIGYYWCFLNKGFNFQPYVCKRCHDLLMMSKYPSDIGILNFKCADYRFIISEIITNLMQSID